jgi:hypothetical protein
MGISKSKNQWMLDYRLKDGGGADGRGTRIRRLATVQSKRGAEAELRFVKSRENQDYLHHLAETVTAKIPFATTAFPEKLDVVKKGLEKAYSFGYEDGVKVLDSIIHSKEFLREWDNGRNLNDTPPEWTEDNYEHELIREEPNQ